MVASYSHKRAEGLAHCNTAPRHTRRLSDKILIAFHLACDQADFEVAERLLKVVEKVLSVPKETPIVSI
jgi:hypothetical protein